MKKFLMLFLPVMMFVATAGSAEKPLGVEEYTSVNELASAISSYFPKVQGEIKTIQGETLTVALGSKDGLKTGVTLSLWRAGREILHPVNGAVLGRMEEEVGEAEVSEVGETTSTIRVIKKIKQPQPGDTARITPKKIRIALIPLRVGQPGIMQELSRRLNELGRFSVVENDTVSAFLKDRKQRDASLIKEMGRTFALDVVAAVEIYPSEGGKLLVTAGMYYADNARPINTIMAMLDLKTKKESLTDVKPFFAPDREETSFFAEGKSFVSDGKVIPRLPFDARLFAVADLAGDGVLHYIFSDGARLHIYLQESKGWREEWSESVPFASGEVTHINIDVADINGNGRPEIFVTAMQNEKVISYVMELQNGAFNRIAAMPGFLRIVKYPGKGDVLIGQNYDPVTFYAGKPKQYSWSEGKYVAGLEFPLPKGVDLYGFVIADLGESQPLLVSLNNNDQLVVYANNSLIWKSEEKYPAVGTTVIKPITGHDADFIKAASEQAEKTGNPPVSLEREKVRIRGRVLALDLNGDGKEEIIVPKNNAVPYLDAIGIKFIPGYKDAEFVGLSWNNARLEERFNIRKVQGIVMDFQLLKQQDVKGRLYVLAKIPGWWIKSDTIQVTSYTIK